MKKIVAGTMNRAFAAIKGLEFVVGDDVQSLVEFSRWLGRPVC
jgi:hypothetical protein